MEQAPNEEGGGHQFDTDREANEVVQDREQEVHGATSSRLCANAAIFMRASAGAGSAREIGRRVCIPMSTILQARVSAA